MKQLLIVIFTLITIVGYSQADAKITKWNSTSTGISRDTIKRGISSVTTTSGIQGTGTAASPVKENFDALPATTAISRLEYVIVSTADGSDGGRMRLSDLIRWSVPVVNSATNLTLSDTLCQFYKFNGSSLTATMPAAPVDGQFITIFNANATNLTVDPNTKNYNSSNVPRTLRQYEYITAKYASGAWYGQIFRDYESYRTYTTSSTTQTISNIYSCWSFTGSTATWTLPTPVGNGGLTFFIKNRGSGNLTINAASGNQIYSTTAVASIIVAAGSSVILSSDNTYFNVE